MELIDRMVTALEKVVIGKRETILQLIKGILAGGHILIEDVPGVGKTTLVKSFARLFDLNFSRIQCTPDLLPSDILGVSIYNEKVNEFEYKKGPVFANIVLADEINRTSPKTQAALLEAMAEYQVTEGTVTYGLKSPFFVLATQNPIEYEGTFKLPEAQLDRFMIKITMGYAALEDESLILDTYKKSQPLVDLEKIGSEKDILDMMEECRQVHVAPSISSYIARIVHATRNNKYIKLGASTRASLALLNIARAQAFIQNRKYVIPEDVKENVLPVLHHRLILTSLSRADNIGAGEIASQILDTIPVPRPENP